MPASSSLVLPVGPDGRARVRFDERLWMADGVDVDYFRPAASPKPSQDVIFCGVLDAPAGDGTTSSAPLCVETSATSLRS